MPSAVVSGAAQRRDVLDVAAVSAAGQGSNQVLEAAAADDVALNACGEGRDERAEGRLGLRLIEAELTAELGNRRAALRIDEHVQDVHRSSSCRSMGRRRQYTPARSGGVCAIGTSFSTSLQPRHRGSPAIDRSHTS